MSIQTLRIKDGVADLRAELVYTKARLQADTNAKDLTESVANLLAQADTAAKNQQAAWDAEIEAEAMVDASDDGLDDTVRALADNLVFVVKDRTSTRFTLYFDQAPANVIRLGLESELVKVKPWPAKLQGEAEPQLQAFGPKLQTAITAGSAAIEQRVTAQTNRATQRARELQKLVDDTNAARKSIYGTLVARAAQKSLGADWAERFFKHATRTAKAPAGVADAAPAASKA